MRPPCLGLSRPAPGTGPASREEALSEAEVMEECRGFKGALESREWGAGTSQQTGSQTRGERVPPPGADSERASLLEVGPLPGQEPPGPCAPSTRQGLPERLLTWSELRLEMRRQEHLGREWVACAEAQGRGQGRRRRTRLRRTRKWPRGPGRLRTLSSRLVNVCRDTSDEHLPARRQALQGTPNRLGGRDTKSDPSGPV